MLPQEWAAAVVRFSPRVCRTQRTVSTVVREQQQNREKEEEEEEKNIHTHTHTHQSAEE
jgi:hypothetical protein